MTDQNILIPEVSDGAEVFKGQFSIISPEETTNLIKNPSVETAITGYALSNSTIARSVTLGHQRRGFYGIDITPAINGVSGVYYTTDTVLTVGQSYNFSCDVFGIHNCKYRIYFADVAGARVSAYTEWLGRNEWKRVCVTWTETSPVTRRLYLVRQPAPEADVFYTDGWMLENKGYCTTYTDGDQLGLTPGELAYGWNGTIHASTSYRSGDTRAGGREMPIAGTGDGVKIMAVVGLGEPPVENFATELNTGGAMYLNTVYKPRNFSLAGSMQSLSGMNQLLKQRAELRSLKSILSTTRRQPMKLRYRTYDAVNCELGGRAYDIVCCYVGGLEGNVTNPDQERITMNFIEYDPGIREDGETAMEIAPFELVDNAGHFCWINKSTGVFSALPIEPDKQVTCMIERPDGMLYIGGNFTTFNGTAVNGICLYNPGTKAVTALGTGLGGIGPICYALALDIYGNLIAGGKFSTAGGTTVNSIAKWDGTTWSVYNVGASVGVHGGGAIVYSVACAPDGTFYIGGDFTDFCAIANTLNVARWNGTTPVAMGTGANDFVHCMKWNLQRTKLYIGGKFTTMNGVATYGISEWSYTTLTWSSAAFITGLPTPGGAYYVYQLEVSLSGVLFMLFSDTALFTNFIYTRSGSAWNLSLRDGIWDVENTPFALDSFTGDIYAGNYIFSGNSWTVVNNTFTNAGFQSVESILVTKSNVYYGTLLANYKVDSPKLTTMPILGFEFLDPVFFIGNQCSISGIENYPSGGNIKAIKDLTLGETITINTELKNITVTSNLTGNWQSNIAAGSVLSKWQLNKKTKNIVTYLNKSFFQYNDNNIIYYSLSGNQRITGLNFSNTDNHIIYISSISDGAGFYHTSIYKASARAAGDLLAHTATYNSNGYKALVADNASGVGGYVYVFNYDHADADIYSPIGYLYLRWQNKYMGIDDVL